MSFRTLFSHTPQHWRNGTTFIGRSVNWIIGEKNYDALRVYKRTMYAEWWYSKQTFLHSLYTTNVDVANMFAILPKPDSSHGFPWRETPSRYGQMAEDTPNSDGFGGWYTYIWVGGASIWAAYIYLWPRRYLTSVDFSVDQDRIRLESIEAGMSATYDSTWLYWWDHWQKLITPHRWHLFRTQAVTHFAPDSKLQSMTLTLNRANRTYDHYWRGTGMGTTMI